MDEVTAEYTNGIPSRVQSVLSVANMDTLIGVMRPIRISNGGRRNISQWKGKDEPGNGGKMLNQWKGKEEMGNAWKVKEEPGEGKPSLALLAIRSDYSGSSDSSSVNEVAISGTTINSYP